MGAFYSSLNELRVCGRKTQLRLPSLEPALRAEAVIASGPRISVTFSRLSRIARDQVTVFPFPKHTRSLQRGTHPEQTPGRFPDSEVYFSGVLSKPEWKEV